MNSATPAAIAELGSMMGNNDEVMCRYGDAYLFVRSNGWAGWEMWYVNAGTFVRDTWESFQTKGELLAYLDDEDMVDGWSVCGPRQKGSFWYTPAPKRYYR